MAPAVLRLAGTVCLSITAWCAFTVLVGLFGQFSDRALVVGVLDIGHALLLAVALGGGAVLARRHPSAATVAAAVRPARPPADTGRRSRRPASPRIAP